MKKLFILVVGLFSLNLYSNECGELKLKGTLKQNATTQALEFNVLETTNSKRIYLFATPAIAMEVAPFVGKQLTLSVKVLKQLDGTRGEINEITFVDMNFDSFFALNKNAIEVTKAQKCER